MMSYNSKITIAMAVYNGGKYIQEQIESIINQTYTNWELIIRDDGSVDDTVAVIRRYAKRDIRISLLEDDKKNLGARENFGQLIKSVTGKCEYLMLADQDDVWNADKIMLTLEHMLETEKMLGKDTPILIHTDFSYVDENLNPLKAKPHIAYRFSQHPEAVLNKLVSQNFLWGCTMMMNSNLVSLIGPISKFGVNHDYWIALVAAAMGHIVFIPQPTMLYRQHQDNVSVGLKSGTLTSRIKRILGGWKEMVATKNKRILLVEDLLAWTATGMPTKNKSFLQEFVRLAKQGGFPILLFGYRNNVKRQGTVQTFLYYILLISKFREPQ
ncbi:glycosyltransferase family 2 protein [Chitinophaga eiseniae]|uniref:Glycosyltransferase family 2 protein n=1 Tax=Chitinophaga eiseniae TaxID=634771 RepID=A0A847S9Y7_9BACT|nr:glycosyltransferase family 2 protein [Chitinophaga eiseniae]NLR78611.1 glycosyltransferase family 2 protein [Chitinophaga eiseniae]